MDGAPLTLHPDRLLPAEPGVRAVARRLFEAVRDLPVLSPHGHVDARVLADDVPFPDPASLFVTPDHYVTRLLHAGGVPLGELGVGRGGLTEAGSRRVRSYGPFVRGRSLHRVSRRVRSYGRNARRPGPRPVGRRVRSYGRDVRHVACLPLPTGTRWVRSRARTGGRACRRRGDVRSDRPEAAGVAAAAC